MVARSIALMEQTATAHGISIHLDCAGAAASSHARADRRRLQQVLLNLLSNAIKYNRPGGRVEILLRVLDNGQLSRAFADHGIGIGVHDLHRVFAPFDRLGQEASTIEGSGIGLALSQSLVVAMGGQLAVESTHGRGSTSTVTLAPSETPELSVGDLGEMQLSAGLDLCRCRFPVRWSHHTSVLMRQ
jgi:signal transduction histidine kinase